MTWRGDLNDDCFLERYGMLAHVECMDRGIWWFAVSVKDDPHGPDLYNTADNETTGVLTLADIGADAMSALMERSS